MRAIVVLFATLLISACASAPPPDAVVLRAPRPLSPAELVQLAEGRALCVRPNNDGSCGSIVTVSVTPDGAIIEDTGLTRIDYYVENFTEFFGADPLIAEADRQLFATLERHRAAGSYDLIRATLRYEGVYDRERRAFCTVPRPDALIFSNAEFAFARSRDTDRTGDWSVSLDLRAQIIDLAERMFTSPTAIETVGTQELSQIRDALRHSAPACFVFYGIEGAEGVRIGSMSTALPDAMEWASTNRVRVDPHPIGTVLTLRVL
ncbi:MAG: hypothetical protein DCF16_13470 [Alphaproteobacteria bacterium]|nr:MAG: hypothetical protein DCF16_13470 [Alphaproteobacteria bacterium]